MRDILTSPRIEEIKHTRRMYHVRLAILFSALAISIVGALGYFSSNRHIVISNIEVTGTRILDQADIQSHVQKDLEGKYFYLFAKANSLIYPHTEIYTDLIKAFPRIQTLSITRTNWNTLSVTIAERSGSYLYCGKTVPEQKDDIGENCYFINNDGYIFDKAPYFSGNVYLKYYAALTVDSDDPLGTQLFSSDHFHDLMRFIDGIKMLGLEPVSIVVDSDGTDSLYLDHKPLDTAPKIVFRDTDDMSTILDNISLAMKKPEFANEIKSKYATLLYIDLRFKNKVLYKFN